MVLNAMLVRPPDVFEGASPLFQTLPVVCLVETLSLAFQVHLFSLQLDE